MTARRLAAALSFGLLAAAALAPASQAFDLTGTWVGSWTCQGFDGDNFKSSNKQSTLLVKQDGNTLAATIDGEFSYNGAAIPDAAAGSVKGEVALIQCGTDNLPATGPEAEILRAKVKANADNGAGSFKGLAVIESDFPDILTCKYSYKRTDTAIPNVSACP